MDEQVVNPQQEPQVDENSGHWWDPEHLMKMLKEGSARLGNAAKEFKANDVKIHDAIVPSENHDYKYGAPGTAERMANRRYNADMLGSLVYGIMGMGTPNYQANLEKMIETSRKDFDELYKLRSATDQNMANNLFTQEQSAQQLVSKINELAPSMDPALLQQWNEEFKTRILEPIEEIRAHPSGTNRRVLIGLNKSIEEFSSALNGDISESKTYDKIRDLINNNTNTNYQTKNFQRQILDEQYKHLFPHKKDAEGNDLEPFDLYGKREKFEDYGTYHMNVDPVKYKEQLLALLSTIKEDGTASFSTDKDTGNTFVIGKKMVTDEKIINAFNDLGFIYNNPEMLTQLAVDCLSKNPSQQNMDYYNALLKVHGEWNALDPETQKGIKALVDQDIYGELKNAGVHLNKRLEETISHTSSGGGGTQYFDNETLAIKDLFTAKGDLSDTAIKLLQGLGENYGDVKDLGQDYGSADRDVISSMYRNAVKAVSPEGVVELGDTLRRGDIFIKPQALNVDLHGLWRTLTHPTQRAILAKIEETPKSTQNLAMCLSYILQNSNVAFKIIQGDHLQGFNRSDINDKKHETIGFESQVCLTKAGFRQIYKLYKSGKYNHIFGKGTKHDVSMFFDNFDEDFLWDMLGTDNSVQVGSKSNNNATEYRRLYSLTGYTPGTRGQISTWLRTQHDKVNKNKDPGGATD